MAQGVNLVGQSQPVYLTDANGDPATISGGGGSTASGPQPAASSQSVTPAANGNPFPVVGNVASGSTDAGNPVKVGGAYNGTLPTFTSGQRGDLQVGPKGTLRVSFFSDQFGSEYANMNPADAMNNNLNRLSVIANGGVFNGSTWDRQRGDTVGTYTVSKGSAGIATTQVSVGTSATQIVAARANRGSVKITNLGTVDVFIGVSGVTSTTGDLLIGTKGASIVIPSSAAIFGIAASAQSVSIMEVF